MFIVIAPFTLPVLLLMWGLDMWLLLAALRLILSYLPGQGAKQVIDHIKPIIDPFPQTINRWLLNHRSQPISPWTPWLLAMGSAFVVRYLLFCLVIGLHNPK